MGPQGPTMGPRREAHGPQSALINLSPHLVILLQLMNYFFEDRLMAIECPREPTVGREKPYPGVPRGGVPLVSQGSAGFPRVPWGSPTQGPWGFDTPPLHLLGPMAARRGEPHIGQTPHIAVPDTSRIRAERDENLGRACGEAHMFIPRGPGDPPGRAWGHVGRAWLNRGCGEK